jgi:hypothetical protein
MSPGVYCKKTLINSGSTVTMEPGLYVFREGELTVNSLSSLKGAGVTLFFQDMDARLNINSDSVFNVTAPASGTYAGVLMFQGRSNGNKDAPPFIINSNGNTRLEGTIYLPLGTLELNSISTANQTAAYTAVIARNMVLNSAGTFTAKSNYAGVTPLPDLMAQKKFVDARLTR